MFETVNYILFQKNKNELDNEILEGFSPYMVGRYLSFYDTAYVDYVNESLNMYGKLFPIKEDQFKFYDNVVPKLRKKRINYFSRPKEVKKKEEEIKRIPEFYSKREIQYLNL